MVQLLLGHGANVNARGRGHKTPLHLAALGGSLDVSRLLIERGADVDAQDDQSQTPFAMALALGHRKLAQFLSNSRVPEPNVMTTVRGISRLRLIRVRLNSSPGVAADAGARIAIIGRRS